MTGSAEHLRHALAERYTIERELGRGGMAVVYLARDLKHDRQVAIKVLTAEVAEGVKTERFTREIQLAAKLTHPNILPVHDSGEAGGTLFYVMPYVEGESLRDRLDREKRLSLEAAVQITREVAEALSYAHEQGVVHRDIKPENILLLRGHAVVMDFGIARALSAAQGQTLTQVGASVGTPLYMSPEQGGGQTVDGRSDIYSLGCVLYEMLAGHPPFTGENTQEVLARHVMDAVPGLQAARAGLPVNVERAVLKALAKQPEDRFATAADLAAALVAPAESGVTVRRGTPRRKTRVVAVTTIALILASGGWFAVYSRSAGKSTAVHDAAWVRAVGFSEIRRLAEDGSWDSAWSIARAAARIMPRDSVLSTVWPQFAFRVAIETDPPDAKVYRSNYAADGEPDLLGTTPLGDAWLPRQISRLRFEKEGYEIAEVAFIPTPLASGGRATSADDARKSRIKLYRPSELPSGMVYVSGARYQINLGELAHLVPVQLDEYFIAKYEVTNHQYQEFVAAGGYRDRKYWQEPFVRDGRPVGWSEAVATFVDRTGQPGPAVWEGGDYPDGQDEYPVAGLSWYEAAAYARFVKKSLPTIYHWARAAGSSVAPSWIVPRSNLGGQGYARVGNYTGMSMFGTYDMAGNVREWCLNQSGDQRYILGGGWNDPTYMFNRAVAESPWDRSFSNGVRLASYSGKGDLGEASRPVPLPHRDFNSEKPVSDEAFAIYRRMFDYDPLPLDAKVEGTDSTDSRWIKQRVSFTAAYGNERVPAWIFLPRGFTPPYQLIIFYPGSNAFFSRSSANLVTNNFNFAVKSGRAVIYPMYKSTYERGDDLQSDIPAATNAYKEHMIMWAKDLRRAVDYAETRPDLDLRKLVYLGASWGGRNGPIMIVNEPRIKVAVLPLAGLRPQRAQPEVEDFNYVSRVRIPVLVLSGRYDPLFPLDKAAGPFFRFLGTPAAEKRQVITDGGHFIPRPILIRETLDWLDRYVGPVPSAPSVAARQ